MNAKTLSGVEFDTSFLNKGYINLAGADEVGRGPLAGPVVVSSVIMDYSNIVDGVRDSKTISEGKREKLYSEIINNAKSVGIGWIEPTEIDELNILNATRKAFMEAINKLELKPDFVLMDYITGVEIEYLNDAIKKGDATSYAIACASIVAKVQRDRYMIDMDKEYPMYGFAKNKGYGTKEHIAAIKKYGTCPLHRMSFLKNILEV